ncbi:hypothetical protein N7527_005254 [Penicillium freii]|nr:hypothetical protein N7527_005254 [Penicillium freii]
MTIFSIRETEEHSFMFERCIALLSDRGATSSGILEQKLRDPLISAYITSQFRAWRVSRSFLSRIPELEPGDGDKGLRSITCGAEHLGPFKNKMNAEE